MPDHRPDHIVDLRSDTVTRPSDGMRAAIAAAEVGDDLLGDDPTVKRLEAASAERIGKEAALFVPSGTMGNLVSLLTHCGRGDEVIAGSESHIVHHEGMGSAALGGISVRTVYNDERGRIDPEEVRATLRRDGWPPTVLVCLENTQNRRGGAAIPLQETREIAAIAHEAGALVHIDGARIFNAAAALETEAATLAEPADTVSFCFSKGLGAPVGSVLTGPAEFIDRARRIRRQVGGAMRQVGVIAAGALYALEHNVDRLSEDHANARRLAGGLAAMPNISIDPSLIDSNLVFFDVDPAVDGAELRATAAEAGVLCSGTAPQRLRMVCHLDVSADDIEVAIERFGAVVERLSERAAATTS
jgi:threonine aldolase